MAKLRPVFSRDGSVSAGNASGLNDAAAAVLLISASKTEELGIKPLIEITAFSSGGLGPVPAIRAALSKAGLSIGDRHASVAMDRTKERAVQYVYRRW